jgi:putative chitinase
MFAFDRARFLADFTARTRVTLTPARREALDFLLAQFERDAGFKMVREFAYVLATIHWETGATFAPIRERRASQEKNPRLYALQQRYWPSGYFGRGYVQLTWDYNYRNAGQKLAGETFRVNGAAVTIAPTTFLQQPDYLLDPAISYRIASRGMREGWFTGKRLSQFITEGAAPDFHNARKIINGLDRAAEIAALANSYELLLRGALTAASPVAPAAVAPVGGAASIARSRGRPAPISVEPTRSPTRRQPLRPKRQAASSETKTGPGKASGTPARAAKRTAKRTAKRAANTRSKSSRR